MLHDTHQTVVAAAHRGAGQIPVFSVDPEGCVGGGNWVRKVPHGVRWAGLHRRPSPCCHPGAAAESKRKRLTFLSPVLVAVGYCHVLNVHMHYSELRATLRNERPGMEMEGRIGWEGMGRLLGLGNGKWDGESGTGEEEADDNEEEEEEKMMRVMMMLMKMKMTILLMVILSQ